MALPPQISSSKYLAVYDISGVLQVLELPTNRSIAIWDGTNLKWVDGSNALPLVLDSIEEVQGGSHPHIVIIRPSGQLMKFTTPVAETGMHRLICDGGLISWEEIPEGANRQIPDTGSGVVAINGNTSVLLGNADGKYLILVNEKVPTTITVPSGDGKVLQIVNGIPTFVEPVTSSAIGGVQGAGIEYVSANNSNDFTVSVTVPVIVLKNIDDDSLTTLTNVTETASLAAADGVGGVDDGGAQNTRFYNMFIVNDGTNTGLILTESLTAPSLANAALYKNQAYVGTFYVESDGKIRSFVQRGVDTWVTEKEWGTNLNITTGFASIVGAVNLNTLIPPNSTRVRGNVGGSAAETASRVVQIAANVDGLAKQFVGDLTTLKNADGTVTAMNFDGFKFDVGRFDLPVIAGVSPTLFWKASVAVTGKRRITISGYKLRG